MNDVISLNLPLVNNSIKKSKYRVLTNIEKEAKNAKLELLKENLREKGINFDNNINDYYDFIEYLRKNLNADDLSVAARIVEESEDNINNMIHELKQGSSSAFKKFITNDNKISYKNTIDNLALAGLFASAGGLGIITGIGYFSYLSIKKLKEKNNYNLIKNRRLELDNIIQELELTKNGNEVVDTRFDEETQNLVKRFLEENHIEYEDTGYLSLRQAIEDLDDNRKEKLCRLINAKKGNKINIDSKLNNYSIKTNEVTKFKFTKKAIVGGLATAGVIAANTFLPGVGAALATGPVVGIALKHLTGSKVVGWLGGICGSAISLLAKYSTYLGPFIGSLPIAQIGTIALAGLGAVALSKIGINYIKSLKNKSKRESLMKQHKKYIDIDISKYAASDLHEIEQMQERLANKKSNEETFIINITCKYMDELGIGVGLTPKNFSELSELISGLDNKNKKKVYYFLSNMGEFLKEDPSKFKHGIKSVGNVVKAAGAAGLGALSTIKLLGIGDFFGNLKNKLQTKDNSASLIHSDTNNNEETNNREESTENTEEISEEHSIREMNERLSTLSEEQIVYALSEINDVEALSESLNLLQNDIYERVHNYITGLSIEELNNDDKKMLVKNAYELNITRRREAAERTMEGIDRGLSPEGDASEVTETPTEAEVSSSDASSSGSTTGEEVVTEREENTEEPPESDIITEEAERLTEEEHGRGR